MHREAHKQCPICPGCELYRRGKFLDCKQCNGSWIPETTLREMLHEMKTLEKPKMESLLSASLAPSRAACPVCRKRMATRDLMKVPVEWCESHGLWFDRAELETVLYRTARNETRESRELSADFATSFWFLVSGLL